MNYKAIRSARRALARAIVACAAVTAWTAAAVAEDTVLVLKGFDHQTYFPAHALAQDLKLTIQDSYLAIIQTGAVLDRPFPKKLEKLDGIRVVVLADVPASALSGFMGRRVLRQFVEQGGGLLVFSGPFSYGEGSMAGTAFEAALPVTILGPWDLANAKSAPVRVARHSPITDGLQWDARPVLCYHHKTTAKPGSETLLECNGAPILATCEYGKGRVATFTATDLGMPAKGEVFFYQWPDYQALVSRVMQWLLRR